MGSGLYFTIAALFIIVLVAIMFFFKKHHNTVETKLYSWLIITNLIGLIIEFACTFASMIHESFPIISNFILKLYLVYIITWATVFAVYVFTISNNKEYIEKIKKTFLIIVKVIYYLSVVSIFILPIELVIKNNFTIRYTTGPSVSFTYGLSTVIIVYMLYNMLKNFKNLKSKKYIPLFAFLVIGAFCMYLQMLNPGLLLMTSVETYIVLLMYFTIENPDLNMLRELEYQKEQVETSKNISSRVINTISDSLSTSVNKINSFGHKKINYDNADELKKSVAEVQKFALEFVNDISSLIELSKTQSEGFEVVNTNYEPLQMLNEIEDSLNTKDKGISVSISKNSTVPAVLYGDPTKIKQCLLHLYNGILNISKVKDIDFNVTYLIVGSLCRFKVNAEVSSKDLLEGYTKDLKDKIIDFEIIDRIAKLLEGKFTITQDNNNQIKLELTVDEKYLEGYYVKEETKSQINKKIDYIDLSSKKVLIIDDDKERQSHLMNLLSPYKIETIVSSDYNSTKKECTENKFDLVIIDDIIPELDRIKNYLLIDDSNGLLKVMDHIEYDVPRVIMVTPNTKNYEAKYIEEGFDEVITKPVDKYKIDEIIKSIVKDKEQDM